MRIDENEIVTMCDNAGMKFGLGLSLDRIFEAKVQGSTTVMFNKICLSMNV